MPHRLFNLAVGMLLALPRPATGQEVAIPPDSAQAQIRSVLRAFYLHLENKNWEALSPYVLSPKLLERRGGPGATHMVTRDRALEPRRLARSLPPPRRVRQALS